MLPMVGKLELELELELELKSKWIAGVDACPFVLLALTEGSRRTSDYAFGFWQFGASTWIRGSAAREFGRREVGESEECQHQKGLWWLWRLGGLQRIFVGMIPDPSGDWLKAVHSHSHSTRCDAVLRGAAGRCYV